MGNDLNRWIETKIKDNGWSISELARRAGVSQSYVSRVLSSKEKPGAKFYLGMAKAFDLPVSAIELLDRQGTVPNEDDQLFTFSEWMTILQELTPAQRVDLLKYAFRLMRGLDDEEDDAVSGEAGTAQPATG